MEVGTLSCGEGATIRRLTYREVMTVSRILYGGELVKVIDMVSQSYRGMVRHGITIIP